MSTIALQKDNPWTGTNIYVNLALLLASFFGGISEDLVTEIVGLVSGVGAAFFAVRNWIVNAKWNPGKNWITDPNNLAYLTAIIMAIIPAAAPLIPAFKGLVESLIAGNWGAIITGAITFISLVYYTFFKKKPAAPAAEKSRAGAYS